MASSSTQFTIGVNVLPMLFEWGPTGSALVGGLVCVVCFLGACAGRLYWLHLISQQASRLRQDYDQHASQSLRARYWTGQYAGWDALRQQSEPLLPR